MMKAQIKDTVKEHFEKELQSTGAAGGARDQGAVAVLHRPGRQLLRPRTGKIRQMVRRSLPAELAAKPQYTALKPLPVDQVHNGYFCRTSKGQAEGHQRQDPGRR